MKRLACGLLLAPTLAGTAAGCSTAATAWPVGAVVTSCSIERVTNANGAVLWDRGTARSDAPGPSMLEFFPADHIAVSFNAPDAQAVELALLSSGSLATWDSRTPIRKEHAIHGIMLDASRTRAIARWSGTSGINQTEYHCVIRPSLLVVTPVEAQRIDEGRDAVLGPRSPLQRLEQWLGL